MKQKDSSESEPKPAQTELEETELDEVSGGTRSTQTLSSSAVKKRDDVNNAVIGKLG